MARQNEKTAATSLSKKKSKAKPIDNGLAVRVVQLPHERDEAPDGEPSAPRKVMKQAATDIANGLKDTDRGAQVNQTYLKLKAKP
jgi:hypothetical protein